MNIFLVCYIFFFRNSKLIKVNNYKLAVIDDNDKNKSSNKVYLSKQYIFNSINQLYNNNYTADIDKNIDVVISPNISNLKSNSNSNDDNDNLISYFMDTNDYEIDNDMSVNVKYSNRVSEIAPIRSWQTRY